MTMKVIFMGTPEFAVPSLEALIKEETVVCVVTRPDRPKGRGLELTSPPVKAVAEKYKIPVLQPEKIKTEEFYRELEAFRPELIAVCAYGKIIPKSILELPPYGCINAHASLLPKYRGAAPVNWAIIRGEKTTGITTFFLDEGMDTGNMLLKKEVPIEEEDTSETLVEKLSHVGAELLIETIRRLKKGELDPIAQNDNEATYAPMLKKEDGIVDWRKSAEEIRNLIRGTLPWPGAQTKLEGKLLKIYKAQVTEGKGSPGEVIKSGSGTLRIATGRGALDIKELQIEGGKRLEVEEFLRGHKIPEGTILGE